MKKRIVLNRRSMLRGSVAGAVVGLGLPTLEAMLNGHGTAFADGEPLPTRFMTWFFGNGVRLDQWTPQTQGPDWELTDELAPLASVREYCSILSGFNNLAASAGRRGHHDGIAGCFSGHPFIALDPMGANYSSKFGGPSIDQVAASHLAGTTYLPSLEVGVSKRVTTVEGPTLQYLSHKGPDQPVPPEYNPQAVYQKLFENFSPKDDPSVPLRVSMLDVIKGDADRLRQRVGKKDQERLEAHLDGLSQIEQQLKTLPPVCTAPGMPGETNEDVDGNEPLEEVSKAMARLVAIAFACDITRVASFMQSGSVGATVYYMTGATTEEHGLSHEAGGQELIHKAVVFNMQCFAYLLEQLKATPDGTGNLLDNSCVFLGSDCAEGITHSCFDQPIIVAGRGGGLLKHPGIHFRSESGQNTSDILLTCLKTVAPEAVEVGSAEGYSSTVLSNILA